MKQLLLTSILLMDLSLPCIAAPLPSVLPAAAATERRVEEMQNKDYRAVLHSVIDNITQQIMYAPNFPLYVPLGQRYIERCTGDECQWNNVVLEESDILSLVQNLASLGYTATIDDAIIPLMKIELTIKMPTPLSAPAPGVLKK